VPAIVSNKLRVRATLLMVSLALLGAGCSGGGSGVAGAMHEGLFAEEGLTVRGVCSG
jgi:hypothetical protein